jgi:hypothetical protein
VRPPEKAGSSRLMQVTIHQDNRQQELLERSQIKARLRIKVAHRTSTDSGNDSAHMQAQGELET